MTTGETVPAHHDTVVPRADGAATFATSEHVRQYLVLKALHSAGTLPSGLERNYAAALEQVCEHIRSGAIVLDYLPEPSGCVDMPGLSSPLYMQALLYWCAELRCQPERLVEAHARLGSFSTRPMLLEMLAQLEREDEQASTDFIHTLGWRAAQRTIPLPPAGGR